MSNNEELKFLNKQKETLEKRLDSELSKGNIGTYKNLLHAYQNVLDMIDTRTNDKKLDKKVDDKVTKKIDEFFNVYELKNENGKITYNERQVTDKDEINKIKQEMKDFQTDFYKEMHKMQEEMRKQFKDFNDSFLLK